MRRPDRDDHEPAVHALRPRQASAGLHVLRRALRRRISCRAARTVSRSTRPRLGYHTFWRVDTDRAGNPGYVSVDYAVGSGVCAYPLPDIVGWWRMEGNTSNTRTSLTTNATRVGLTSDVFVDAIVGQGYQFAGANGYLQADYSPTIFNDKKLALAAWVNPSANTRGTIMRAREMFGVARLETGNIGWAFRKFNVPGLSYRDTGVKLPLGRWSHVVVMLDGTAVRTYLNGRLAHTETNIGDVYNASSYAGHDRRRRQQRRLLQGRARRAPDFQTRAERLPDRAAVPGRQRRRLRAEEDVVPDRGADPGVVRIADVCVRRAAGRRGRQARRRTRG